MRKFGVFVALAAALFMLGGCTQPATAPTNGGSSEASQGIKPDRPFVMVGKTKMYLDPDSGIDPMKFPHSLMDGEPSANAFFKPAKDQGILDRVYPASDPKTFKFLSISISTVNPAPYYMFAKDGGTLNKAAAKTGYKFVKIDDDGDNKILPNLYIGYYDFAWVPFDQLPELWCGHESREAKLWRAGNEYVLLGITGTEGQQIVAPPSITSISQLGGKQVGIMNPTFSTEAAFNAMLNKVGLATESAGGTVKIAMSAPSFAISDLVSMHSAAEFARSKYLKQLQAGGYKPIGSTDEVWGGQTPRIALIVRRDILEKHPDIVQMVVQQNYNAIKTAKSTDAWQQPALDLLKAYKEKYAGPPVNVSLPKELGAEASPVFVKGVYDYMTKYGYFVKPYPLSDLFDNSFYLKVKK